MITANAQREVGTFTLQPKVGVNISTLTDEKLYFQVSGIELGNSDASYRAGIIAGVEAEYQITPIISVAAGLLYSQQGCNFDDISYSVAGVNVGIKDTKYSLDYINVPIVANFYVAKGFALKIGLQPEFCVSAKYKSTEYGNLTGDINLEAEEKTEKDIDGKKSVGLSIPVGASYEFTGGWVIDARYNWGLTKVFEATDSKNSVFNITFGYKFDL